MEGISRPAEEIFRQSAVHRDFDQYWGFMQANIQLDDMDARILTALSGDSRRSYADVATEVGLSTAAVHERVKKMVERGVIERFSLRVDPDRVGLRFTAFVAIRNDGGVHCREVAPRLRELPEVLELHSVAGEYDFLAKIRTTHARALEDVLYQIKAIPGVARTTSTVVLNTEFEDRPLQLPG
jgi:Lrp/AsnC family leucine-responsive transcriptional regulator